MASTLSDGELYPGKDFTVSQLLYATKKKLRGIALGGRTVTPLNRAEVKNLWTDEPITTLERGMLEVLCLLRSMQNTFTPINRIPPDVLSLIPDYWRRLRYRDWRDADRDVVSLTHVCRGWREIFTSRSSLWTCLDCKNSDKTHAYIERSRSLPLEVYAVRSNCTSYSNDVLLGLAPHTNRFGSLSIYSPSEPFQGLLDQFTSPVPFFKQLKIVLPRGYTHSNASAPSTTFPEHLSSLRDLSLSGVDTHLPWRNLSNLTTFRFRHPEDPDDCPFFMTRLLDFFESTPLIRKIVLCDSIPISSTVPPGRVVPLINLENLAVYPLSAHSLFLDHLSIPTGASLDLHFFWPPGPRIPTCLTNAFDNLRHITTISLLLDVLEFSDMRLSGPSGELRTTGYSQISQIFHSLRKFDLSKTRILSITMTPCGTLEYLESSTIPRSLLPMCNLRTLTLTRVDNLPFIQALNPKQNKSCTLLCPELKELVLYIEEPDWYYVEELKEMLLERNRRHSGLSSITIVGLGEACARSEVMSLRRCVPRLTHKSQKSAPEWQDVFGGIRGGYSDREWDYIPDPFELLSASV